MIGWPPTPSFRFQEDVLTRGMTWLWGDAGPAPFASPPAAGPESAYHQWAGDASALKFFCESRALAAAAATWPAASTAPGPCTAIIALP